MSQTSTTIEGKTSKVTIVPDPNFAGANYVKPTWYVSDIKKFLDMMKETYVDNSDGTLTITSILSEEDQRSLEELFDIFVSDEELPEWLSIEITANS